MQAPQRKITEEDRRIIKLAEDMKGLLRFVPFAKYLEALRAHEDAKRQELERPATDPSLAMGMALVNEANKGAIAAFKLARTMPQVIIATADQISAEVSLPDEGE